MTNPTPKTVSDISKIVEALKFYINWKPEPTREYQETFQSGLREILPLASSLSEQWDEMVEAKKALDLLFTDYPSSMRKICTHPVSKTVYPDCPAIIKRMIEKGE